MTEVTSRYHIERPDDELALYVDSGPTELVPLCGRTITIGRRHSNDVVIEDLTVSSHHCQVSDRSGHYRIRDLGSRNGTRLNGVPVREGVLFPGAKLGIGQATLYCVRRPTSITMGAGPDRLVGKAPAVVPTPLPPENLTNTE